MSKIVILLFAVLVASAVDACGTMDQLKSLQNRLESYFTTEIDKVEEKYNTTKQIIREKSGIIYNKDENSIYANASDDVNAILSKAQEETRELIIQAQNTFGTKECREKAIYLNGKAEDFLSHVYRCTSRILAAASGLISYIETTYERLHSSLIDRRNSIAVCHRIVNKTEEVARAISCSEAIENETRSFIAESVPPVFADIDEANNFLSTFESLLDNCSNDYAAFQREAADLTKDEKICYQQKIDEAAARRSRIKAATGDRKSVL